ncbi:MAG: hypothetical protein H5T86_16840, partial [Armatimonadetes bacterium]|nr:hypothetical protein [Armatimonadota bacterium]
QITREDIQQSSSAVRETLEEAHWTALAFGWMVGAAILIGAMAGMPPKHCLIVGVMAFLYELYLFSRHWHAVELFAGALSGELVHEARMVAEQEQFHPSAWQKAAMWLGWRPRPANNPTAHRTRQRQRR